MYMIKKKKNRNTTHESQHFWFFIALFNIHINTLGNDAEKKFLVPKIPNTIITIRGTYLLGVASVVCLKMCSTTVVRRIAFSEKKRKRNVWYNPLVIIHLVGQIKEPQWKIIKFQLCLRSYIFQKKSEKYVKIISQG